MTPTGGTLRVLAPGALALVQDLGRPGREGWGVAPSGAFDRGAHAAAQRLAGNLPQAAGLELLLGGLVCVAEADVVVAVAGPPCSVRVGDRLEAPGVALRLGAGDRLTVGVPATGARVYVAVRGGLAVPPVLGSRSRDTGAGLGPAPLRAGDLLPVGPAAPAGSSGCTSMVAGDAWFGPVPATAGRPEPAADEPAVAALVPGPHDDLLPERGWAALEAAAWTVGGDSDRVGVRLAAPGRPLAGAAGGDLPSIPVVPGSVQLTPSGELVVLGPDAGVTGGYPVVGVVAARSLDLLGQCRPGDAVRLRRVPARTHRSPGRAAGAPR